MKLVSLKREMEDSEDEKDSEESCCVEADKPDYPYGTCIMLCEDEIQKLGIKTLPAAGKPAMIEAMALVKSVSETTSEGETKRMIEFQITDIAVSMTGSAPASVLYDKK